MTPLKDRVIVKPVTQQEYTTESGLYVADDHAADTAEVMGTVVSVCDGACVQADDVVIFSPQAGLPLDYDGARYRVLKEDDILAVWE